MKNGTMSPMTIFFVDVAGSVELYDSIGDLLAHEKIVGCLNWMSSVIEGQGGRVVEIVGDEIMAAFSVPDHALAAATQIQTDLLDENEPTLGVRIGFHSGPTAHTEGHPYGDTVNVAARMVNLAKSGQIITNHLTVEELSEANRARLRVVDKAFIKGKPNPYTIHEVVWDESESTMVLTLPQSGLVNRRRTEATVYLKYQNRVVQLNQASGELVLGRGQRCGLVIQSGTASRTHAMVSCRNGLLVIKDQSTNGTFIRTFKGKRATDGIDLFIHHEEWMADAAGVFSLGEAIKKNDPNLVYFRIL